MGVRDHGGFDAVLTLATSGLRRLLAPAVAAPIPDATFPVDGWGTWTLHTELRLDRLDLAPDCTVTVAVGSGGSELRWPSLDAGGVHLWDAGSAPLDATVTVRGRPAAAGTALRLELAPDAASVHLARGTLERIPVVQVFLGLLWILDPAGFDAAVEGIYTGLEQGLADGINAGLPDTVALGSLPTPPIRAVELACAGDELRVLLTVGGSRGTPALIDRSPIRRDGTGQALDIAGVVVSNTCLLRDILRPALGSFLGLAGGGFLPVHPCLWAGSAPLPVGVAGMTPAVRSLLATIDAPGRVTVRLSFDGSHPTGAFGLTGAATVTLGVGVTGTGAGRSLTFTLTGTAITALDVWVAWWVYVTGIVVSPLLTLAVGLTDAFAGGALAGSLNGAITRAVGTAAVSLPIPPGPVTLTGLSLAQADAPTRSVSLGPVTLTDRMNDATMSFG